MTPSPRLKVLIVYAHPSPHSFNAALRDVAVATLTAAGHEVQVSDLYAQGFNPVAGPGDFTELEDGPFNLQQRQLAAVQGGGFEPALAAEMAKLAWCNCLILQFPLWWFSMPAILKGWIDRVFAYGFCYGQGGTLAGKRAMVAVSTGGPEHVWTPEQRGSVEGYLKHALVGALAFCDMDVLPTFIAYGPGRTGAEERVAMLEAYGRHLAGIEAMVPAIAGRAGR